jgi:hypothetical protein
VCDVGILLEGKSLVVEYQVMMQHGRRLTEHV